MNGSFVGRWTLPARGPMEFGYDPAWVASSEARPLSLSLPMNLDGVPLRGERVGFYFDNLLPDSDAIRRRIRERFRVSGDDSFGLLEAIGRDCVGAVQLLPDGEAPANVAEIHATPLSDSAIETCLRVAGSTSHEGFGKLDDFRISLAGAQEKTAFTRHRGRFCKPEGATPTTHIFKLPLGLVGGRRLDLRHSLENEWLCARLLHEYGLPVASSTLRRFGTTTALVVERFDRKLHSSRKFWLRLPQEDFCQATGTPSHLKYEADGGPGLLDIAGILRASETRDEDLATLLRAQLLFVFLAATDGHAKNFSLRLLPAGRYRLTPLYDVISAWPVAGSGGQQIHPKKLKLALAMLGKNKHYAIETIARGHFVETARRAGLRADMQTIIDDIVDRTPAVVAKVESALPDDFPGRVFDTVTRGLTRSAKRFGVV